MERARITIFDTTLRDGEQSPGCSMNVQEKLRMAHQLDRLGVDVIEAGFPIASEGDFEAVQAIAAVIRRPVIAGSGAGVCSRHRACLAGFAASGACLAFMCSSRLPTFTSNTSCESPASNAWSRRGTPYVWRNPSARRGVFPRRRDPHRSGFPVPIAGSGSRSRRDHAEHSRYRRLQRCPRNSARLISDSPQAGARNREDRPSRLTATTILDSQLRTLWPPLAAGRDQVECTINGIGERAGNASLEEIRDGDAGSPRPLSLTIPAWSASSFIPASQLLSEITGVPVQPNKAIIGRNAFAHEAGIHQDGVLKNPLTYEIMTPQSVGVPDSTLVLGKHSGRHALGLRCEQLGYQFDRRELDDIYRRVCSFGRRDQARATIITCWN